MRAPKGTYPIVYMHAWLEDEPRYCEATGEYRKPRKGEYYLSGAIVCGYLAPNDLSTEYWIAKPIKPVKQL